MMYTELNIGNKKYNCRLSAKSCVLCERSLGRNLLNVLSEAQETSLPKLGDLLTILHFAIGCTKEDEIYDIYDEYVEEGHTIMDLLELIVKIYEDSGLIPKDEVKEEAEKN